jgi:penicillin-binding protein 2
MEGEPEPLPVAVLSVETQSGIEGMHHSKRFRILPLILVLCLAPASLFGAVKKKKSSSRARVKATVSRTVKKSGPKARTATIRRGRRTVVSKRTAVSHASRRRVRRVYSPWTEPTFADSTSEDYVDGEDLTVRRAAVEALGPYNGSVVVVNPDTGRILTMVNQKLALKSGFDPCSTIKIVAALAGLSEGIIERSTLLRVYGRHRIGLTEALAHSNNPYFARVGETLGFEKVSYYARQFGLGEKAGLDIPGEQAGILPSETPKLGMGMMTSFGSGIALTPLELAAIMASVANGGTLYYLQYPRTQEEAKQLVPRVKRHLDIGPYIPEIKPGMMGAVEYGTARRANYNANEPIMGKTGTCTDSRSPTHLGWFGSFNDVGKNKLAVVVLLTGGRGVSGPIASGIAGQVYQNLSKVNYFESDGTKPVAFFSSEPCCAVSAGN